MRTPAIIWVSKRDCLDGAIFVASADDEQANERAREEQCVLTVCVWLCGCVRLDAAEPI